MRGGDGRRMTSDLTGGSSQAIAIYPNASSPISALGDVAFGSLADIASSPIDVRFAPESGHWFSVSACLPYAKSRHMHCSK
jgi:hypothetical protein